MYKLILLNVEGGGRAARLAGGKSTNQCVRFYTTFVHQSPSCLTSQQTDGRLGSELGGLWF